MKNLRNITFAILFALIIGLNTKVFAGGVGFINYKKVQDNYSYAQTVSKELDNKSLELQQYLVDKEKQFKSLDTPLKKKNFEDKTKKEFEAKQSAFINYKLKKEEEVFNKIQDAATQVLVEQKLDAIVDYRTVFVGGVDVTDLVIAKLKSAK
ncbi:OmpH family outer membrane protein [bacterium]|nr:OmpH family outer membrane protein [bacterium]